MSGPAPPWVVGWEGGRELRDAWTRAHPPAPGVFLQPFPGDPGGSPGDGCSLVPALGAAPAFDFRGLSGHFSSLQKVHVNTVIKKNGSRGCAEAKNGTEVAQRERGATSASIFLFNPQGANSNGEGVRAREVGKGEGQGRTHPQKKAGEQNT